MKIQTLVKRSLPQNPAIEVLLPNYKEPILPVNHGGFGWYGLQAYNEQGQLMCHECGKFYEELAKHIKRHRLSSQNYKVKYGLLQKTKLVSSRASQIYRDLLLKNPEAFAERVRQFEKIRLLGSGKNHPKGTGNWSLEFQNLRDTCPAQLLRWLTDAAKVYGEQISEAQANEYRPGLNWLLKLRFGTFNKAKQLVRLVTNTGMPKKYSKDLILEDMVCFYSKYGHWPTRKDYENGMMICSRTVIFWNGGMRALRLEAMKLKEEQESRAKLAEQIPLLTERIEREYAGYARR